MKVCVLGSGLASLTLAKGLINHGIKVDLISNYTLNNYDKSQTLGISQSNIDFFNKKILNIDSLLWNINKIEIFSDNLNNENIIKFENKKKQLFSIIKNYKLFNYLLAGLKKSKLFKIKKNKKIIPSNKEYNLQDIILKENNQLGNYQNEEIQIKSGRYGYYAEWGDKKESIKDINVPLEDITLEILTEFLNKKQKENKPVLREINEQLSVRKSKFGLYIYYKTSSMKKPRFLNIKKFEKGVLTCEKDELINWLIKEYNIS